MSIENQKKRAFGKPFIIAMICFFIIISLFYLLIIAIKPMSANVKNVSEIEQIDLSEKYVRMNAQDAIYYSGELYEPKDFFSSLPTPKETDAKYGTYRIQLTLPKGTTYGITGLTADYTQKVYVNGELLSKVGQISDNEAGFIPKTDYYTVYFTPQTDTTEIVIQVAHFNHEYGFLKDIYLAEQQVIVERNRAEFLSNGLILGVLLSFVIFFLGMFLSYTERISFLWFALACLCAALHYSLYFSKDIMVVVPNLSWYVLHKAEYLSRLGFYMFLVVHVLSVLKIKIVTWIKCVFFGGLIAIAVYYVVMPSNIYTKYIFVIGVIITVSLISVTVYILWQGYKNKAFDHKENLIVGLSVVFMTVAWLMEAFTYQGFSWYIQPYITMLIVFFNAVALTMQFSRTERELGLLQIREREIAKTAAMLERTNNMKTEFFNKMAHEIRTPLTIMSGYAQLTAKQIENEAVNDETTLNLKVISAEANRLAELASNLMNMPAEPISDAVLSELSMWEYLCYVSVVCRGLLEKKGNELIIKGSTNQNIIGNMEMLVQMMINLTVNSNNHMENGEFTIEVVEENGGDIVALRVSDTGSGIPIENANKVFEKGFTTNGTKGFGLSICKEIAHLHKGDIVLLTDNKQGAVFKITIPTQRNGEE